VAVWATGFISRMVSDCWDMPSDQPTAAVQAMAAAILVSERQFFMVTPSTNEGNSEMVAAYAIAAAAR
jgi:hypothetical protein